MPRPAGRARRSRPGPTRTGFWSSRCKRNTPPSQVYLGLRRIPIGLTSPGQHGALFEVCAIQRAAMPVARAGADLLAWPGPWPGYPRHKGRWSCGSVSIGAGAVCPCARGAGRAGADRGRGGERAGREDARMMGARQLRPRSAPQSRQRGSCRRLGPAHTVLDHAMIRSRWPAAVHERSVMLALRLWCAA